MEDLNLAPPEVLAALVPLLEGRALHLSHRSQVVAAAPGFQFIASVTTAPGALFLKGLSIASSNPPVLFLTRDGEGNLRRLLVLNRACREPTDAPQVY